MNYVQKLLMISMKLIEKEIKIQIDIGRYKNIGRYTYYIF